ncbi:uncharacterized protein LOC115441366 [Manduca sexta]|uniref:Uncharacterized protein n=1 Tax=Manduca sexta TaxID=7130 RepID=A0A921YWE5_MANSE|nr:uncharacterized protein LOC115441366 [Manduca sexta]KAG6446879.1 hypothetical protein O3G_MSEX004613 [Manduca sexta]
MDVYGYSLYQYNQSDELVKQMFNQPGYPNLPEPHVMPAPSGAPWNIQGLSWGMPSPPQLVQFTAESQELEPKLPVVHCKRKSAEVEPVIPAKQLITEEKMAAHLRGLHISSDYTSHTSEDMMEVTMESVPSTSGTYVSEKLKGHTIVLSEELKKIKDEPLLPAALIERLEKPSMSLVVWKPRENILEKLKDEEKKQNTEDPPKRNGVLVPNDISIDDIEM